MLQTRHDLTLTCVVARQFVAVLEQLKLQEIDHTPLSKMSIDAIGATRLASRVCLSHQRRSTRYLSKFLGQLDGAQFRTSKERYLDEELLEAALLRVTSNATYNYVAAVMYAVMTRGEPTLFTTGELQTVVNIMAEKREEELTLEATTQRLRDGMNKICRQLDPEKQFFFRSKAWPYACTYKGKKHA
jgi:hypothetical protein